MKVKTETLRADFLSEIDNRRGNHAGLSYTVAVLPVDIHPKLILVLLLLMCCPRC